MWKDLTLKQKAEIMKMSVANGVTDINDIQQLYDGLVGHRFDGGSRIITLADLPREYVQKYGHINVVTPKGVRMPLSQAYRDYNQTPINVNDVPGLTDYLIKQDQPDISEQAHIDKVAADREVRQRNNIINGPIFDKKKIYNRVPGDMWQAVVSDKDGQNIGANRGIVRSLFGYYFNPDNAVESRLQRYKKYKDLSMEEVMNAGIEFDRMWEKYGLDSIRNNPILSRKMTELESKMRAPYVLQHEDAKDLYLGLPQRNNTIRDAEYSPTNGTLRNGKYVSYMRDPAFINDVIMPSYNHLKRNFIDRERIKRGFYKDHSYNMNISPVKEITPRGYARVEFPFLNNATLSGGIDPQRGEYASIFDTWDYNTNIMGTPGDNVGEYIGGEPFDIYDRYYLDDYYGINSKPRGNGYYGGYLPELLVINKKALGGHLYKNAGPIWSNNPASMIEHFEGFRESPYRDGTAWSVGYGQYKNGYGANLDWDALLSGKKKLTRSEAHQQVLRTVEDLKKKLKNTLGEKLYNSLTPGQLMGYLDTGYQRPASMINAAKVHKSKGAAAAVQVLGVNGFADRNAARRAAFTGNWDNYKSTNNRDYSPNKSTSDAYFRQTLNNYEAPAFQLIALENPNTSNPWLDYIRSMSSISNQGINPISNTPIRPTNTGLNGIKSTFTPTDFSSLSNPSDVVSPLEPYAAKQNIEYGLGLEGNALWNSPYLLFENS